MTAGVGQLIQATDYNSIRTTVDAVMGKNASGYGQTLSSSAVSAGNVISALQWLNLRTDIVKARQHQIGSAVGTSTATDGRNLVTPASGASITETLRAQFATMATTISTNQRTVDIDGAGGQLSDEELITVTQSSSWGGTSQSQILTHTVTITGATGGDGSASNLKYFFNAGGSIRVSANITTGSQKNNDWNTMFTQMGEFRMNYTATTYTGSSATGSAIGFDDLTTSNQQIGTKAAPSGAYSENVYYLYARTASAGSQIILTMEYRDNDAGDPNFDEAVLPTLNTLVKQFRPSGSNVSVLSPTAA
jgi:hypothetical protein